MVAPGIFILLRSLVYVPSTSFSNILLKGSIPTRCCDSFGKWMYLRPGQPMPCEGNWVPCSDTRVWGVCQTSLCGVVTIHPMFSVLAWMQCSPILFSVVANTPQLMCVASTELKMYLEAPWFPYPRVGNFSGIRSFSILFFPLMKDKASKPNRISCWTLISWMIRAQMTIFYGKYYLQVLSFRFLSDVETW